MAMKFEEDVLLIAGEMNEMQLDNGQWSRVPRLTTLGDIGDMAESKEKTTLEDRKKRYGAGMADAPDMSISGQYIPDQTETSPYAKERPLQQLFINAGMKRKEFQMRTTWSDGSRAQYTFKALGFKINDGTQEDWKTFTIDGKQNSDISWITAPELETITVNDLTDFKVGQVGLLNIINSPLDAFYTINADSWTTSDSSVLTVTPTGVVQGISAGTATITVTRMCGNEVVTTSQEITVTEGEI